MKTIYTWIKSGLALLLLTPVIAFSQNRTTTVASSNCNFTYNFNSSDEGFSSPSIYSDANDLGLYWDGSQLAETSGVLGQRSASTISGIYVNTESNRTTVGFDYNVPTGTEYRVRIISGITNPPLEILATTANGPVWTALPGTSGSICLELQDLDLTIGAQIRYEITFRTSSPGNMTIDNFRRQFFNAPLPVTFLGFIARENNDGSIKLLWNVGEESNVRGYEVQSSSDGINFGVEGFVDARGKDNYQYNYAQSFRGVRYFRVRNVDRDNNYKYTAIIKVRSDEQSTDIRLYPVPATDQLYIEHPKTQQPVRLTVVNSTGVIVKQTISLPGSFQSVINVASLQPGLYFLRYEGEGVTGKTVKFVKN